MEAILIMLGATPNVSFGEWQPRVRQRLSRRLFLKVSPREVAGLEVGDESTDYSIGLKGRSWTMRQLKDVVCIVAIACGGLTLSGCNTTKATVDTTVNFSSSTSPQELFTQDGLVEDSQKVKLYTAVVFENLQQDMAQGRGEYVTSLGVLQKVPQDRQVEWSMNIQNQYPALFSSAEVTSSELLAALGGEPTPLK